MNYATNVLGLTLIILPFIADGAVLFSGGALLGKRLRIFLVSWIYFLVALCLPLYAVISIDPKHIREGILIVVLFRATFLYVVGKTLYGAWMYPGIDKPKSQQFLPLKMISAWTGTQKRVAILGLITVGVFIIIIGIQVLVIKDKEIPLFNGVAAFVGCLLLGVLGLALVVVRWERFGGKVTKELIELILITALCWSAAIFVLVKTQYRIIR